MRWLIFGLTAIIFSLGLAIYPDSVSATEAEYNCYGLGYAAAQDGDTSNSRAKNDGCWPLDSKKINAWTHGTYSSSYDSDTADQWYNHPGDNYSSVTPNSNSSNQSDPNVVIGEWHALWSNTPCNDGFYPVANSPMGDVCIKCPSGYTSYQIDSNGGRLLCYK